SLGRRVLACACSIALSAINLKAKIFINNGMDGEADCVSSSSFKQAGHGGNTFLPSDGIDTG
ncbi:hypothetical protein, partial [Brucella suis]|uniref:hypothetical protein n=1 Tax=Brucella suis TaxID=29461 RepID=UPI001FB18668